MTIQFEHPEFHASVAEVRRTAASLSEARARASGEVSDLLDTWHGSAAAAFAEAWSDWLAASAEVASSLSGMADKLEHFQIDIATCDASSALSLGELTRRLA